MDTTRTTKGLFRGPTKQLQNMNTMMDLATSLKDANYLKSNSKDHCIWNDLPNELLLYIFKFLPQGDLQQIRSVSKRWHHLLQLPEFMQKTKLVVNNENIAALHEYLLDDQDLSQRLSYDTLELHGLATSDELQMILQVLGSGIHKLRLYKSPVFALLSDNLPQLEELSVTHIPTVQSDNTFAMDFSKFPKFKSLDIACSNVTTYIKTHMILSLTRNIAVKIEKLCFEMNRDHEELLIYTLQYHAESLQHLEIILRSTPIMMAKWKQVFVLFKNLKTLKLTGVSCYLWLKDVFACLPKEAPLRHLDLSGGLQVDDSLLKLIVTKWPTTLEVMELMFCSCLTDDGVKSLGVLKQSLKSLNISHCSKISTEALLQGLVKETNHVLTTLILNDVMDVAPDAMCLMLQRLPNLTYLSLESCRDAVTDATLDKIFRHQTKLQHLVLDDCMRISDEGILGFGEQPAAIYNLKGLQTLSLRGCRNLSNRALTKGLKFVELRKLVLGYCHKISSMGIEELVENCSSLEDLTISSCLMIDDDAMLHIAQGLPRLRRLNVSNCINLTGKSIDYVVELCKSLKELSMCGIDSLEIQEVQDKFLQMKPQIMELHL